jgi:hypothetical protein
MLFPIAGSKLDVGTNYEFVAGSYRSIITIKLT